MKILQICPVNLSKAFFKQVVPDAIGNPSHGRCPICGDSRYNKKKRRMYLLVDRQKNLVTVFCHNCGYSRRFDLFLKENFPQHYDRYIRDVRAIHLSSAIGNYTTPRSKQQPFEVSEIKKLQKTFTAEKHLAQFGHPLTQSPTTPQAKKIHDLAIKMLKSRNYPKEVFEEAKLKFKYCIDGQYAGRLILPYFTSDAQIYYFQARDVTGTKCVRYLSWHRTDAEKKIIPPYIPYNWFNIDRNKVVYVLEGILDALYFPNAIATAGVPIGRLQYNFITQNLDRKKVVYIFDNDKAGHREAEVHAKRGGFVFIWPKKWKDFKDMGEVFSSNEFDKEIFTTAISMGDVALTKLKMNKTLKTILSCP